jgi:phosphoglycerate dehydrogenase-like enzyme
VNLEAVGSEKAPQHETITPENSKLGFVGVGYMGRRIAQRLESGFKLKAYDRDRSKAERLLQGLSC